VVPIEKEGTMMNIWFVRFRYYSGEHSAWIPTGCSNLEAALEYATMYRDLFVKGATILDYLKL
jgi:hypothetical protein